MACSRDPLAFLAGNVNRMSAEDIVAPIGLRNICGDKLSKETMRGPRSVRFPAITTRTELMLTEDRLPNHRSLTIAARVLFSSLFLLSGVTHFTNIPYYVSLMPEAVPFPIFWTLVSGVVELAGAAMILFNWRPRLGGWLLVIFLIPVTFVVHGYELVYAKEEAWRLTQQAHFFKGFALMGAALLITQLGVTHQPAPQSVEEMPQTGTSPAKGL